MFGKRLKQLREEVGISQEDLGKIVNVSNKTISIYEKGGADPSTETLTRLADFFNVSTDYLLGRIDIRTHPTGKSGLVAHDLGLFDNDNLVEIDEDPELNRLVAEIIRRARKQGEEKAKKQK